MLWLREMKGNFSSPRGWRSHGVEILFYAKTFVFHYFIVILVDLKHVPDCSQVGIMMNSENANSLFCDVYAAVVVTPLYPRETYLASTCVVVVFFLSSRLLFIISIPIKILLDRIFVIAAPHFFVPNSRPAERIINSQRATNGILD